MQKIKSLFKRDYEGNRQIYDEVVPGSEWVIVGEGTATIKWDGTCCKIENGRLFKRYDRKLIKSAARKKRDNPDFVPKLSDFKPEPTGWEAAEPEPDKATCHWPGWLTVDFSLAENRWHKEAWEEFKLAYPNIPNGTYELVGPKIHGNPYELKSHILVGHGWDELEAHQLFTSPPRDFEGLKEWFSENEIEGIVWHHPDGRMVKIKRRDFGFEWPPLPPTLKRP